MGACPKPPVHIEDDVITLNPATTAGPSPRDHREESLFASARSQEIDDEMGNVSSRPVEKWAAIVGRWKFSGTTATYLGSSEPDAAYPLGLAKASLRFRDGVIRTRVKLSQTEKTCGGLLFGFHSAKSAYLSAALGAFDKAYAVVDHRVDAGWSLVVDSAGLLSNLSKGVEYDLRVAVAGQSIRMMVDDTVFGGGPGRV
jgi:hypothetical protein